MTPVEIAEAILSGLDVIADYRRVEAEVERLRASRDEWERAAGLIQQVAAGLGTQAGALAAKRDALVEAARLVVDWHDALDGNMEGTCGQDAIERLAALLPPAAGPIAPGRAER